MASAEDSLWQRLDKILLTFLLYFGTPLLRCLHALFELIGGPPTGPPVEDEAVLWFDSAGLLLPYHIGVAEYVSTHYDCSSLVAAGISGGYAPAATLVMGVTIEAHWQAVETLRALGRNRWLGAFFFSSKEMIEHGYLPQLEASEAAALDRLASGRMWIGCSEIFPRFGRAVWVRRFASARAICHACTCRCSVPPEDLPMAFQ